MERLRKELEKEFTRKGKPLLVKAVFKALEEGSGCMLEVEDVFKYLKYLEKSFCEKYNAYVVLTADKLSISVSYKNLSLIGFYTLKQNKNIKQFADLYNNKEEDILYFIASINEVEVSTDCVMFDIDILEASSSVVSDIIIK